MIKKIFFVISLSLTACSAIYKQNVRFNPLEPIRVAVLPFAFVDENGAFIMPDKGLLVDEVSLVSKKLEDSPENTVRKMVQSEFSKTALDLVSPGLVDAQLAHHGFENKGVLDINKVFNTSGKELCEKLLSCDALLYGKIKKWDRTYLALQTQNEVAIELKLVSAKDGRVLFDSEASDSDGRGLSKGPTGFSNLVIEPVKGLGNEIITELAQRVVTKSMKPLTIAERPGFLNSSPPAIFASAHDAKNGQVSAEKPLTVLILGSGEQLATFSIGDVAIDIPMIEKDPGHYFGQFYPLPEESFSNQKVQVKLTDGYGRATEFLLEKTPISTN